MERPLILVGTGRCGSTALHALLGRHEELAWLSPSCRRLPERPAANRLIMASLDLPIAGAITRRFARPHEAYPFWDRYYFGFASPCRDLTAEDVPPKAKARLREVFGAMLTRRRRRMLVKITGWPRLGFLTEVFPDAKFVHIYRDGRAVASSLVKMPWWDGWGGPSKWKWGDLTADQRARWEGSGRSFVVLAGIEWEILMAAFERARTSVPEATVLEISYEELCRDKQGSLCRIVEFAELAWSVRFEREVATFPFTDSNHKWREDLSIVQQRELERALSDPLARYGYSTAIPRK